MDFVRVGENIFQVTGGGKEEPLATSDQGKPDQICENKKRFLHPESSDQKESRKVDFESFETELNLSEASSTNETTLDECQSQSSYTSPTLIPRKLSWSQSEQDGTLIVKSSASLPEHD